MKTYLWILIILLLIISVYYVCRTCYTKKSNSKKLFQIEGFEYNIEGSKLVKFNNSKEPNIYIPQYSADSERILTLLYDRFYFDEVNGNLVEIVPTKDGVCKFGEDCENDNTGTTIAQIIVVTRDGNIVKYPTSLDEDGSVVPFDTDASMITTISTTRIQYNYVALNGQYQVLYFSIDNRTYIHIFLVMSGKYRNICTYAFDNENPVEPIMYENTSTVFPKNNVQEVIDESPYETDVVGTFNITENIYMNMQNQSLNIYGKSDTYIYPIIGGGSTATNVPPDVEAGTPIEKFTSWAVNDDAGNMVLVIAYLNDIIVGSYSIDLERKITVSNGGNKKCITHFDIETNTPTSMIQKIIVDINVNNSMYTLSVPTTNPVIISSTIPTMSTSVTESSYNFDDVNITFDTSAPYPDIEICGDNEECKRYVNYYKREMNINDSNDYIRKSEIIPGITDNEKYMAPCRATSEPTDYCKSKNVTATTNPNIVLITNPMNNPSNILNNKIDVPTNKIDVPTNKIDVPTNKIYVPTKKTEQAEEEGQEEGEEEEKDDYLDDLLDDLVDVPNVSDKIKKLVDYLTKEEELSTPRPNTSIGDTKGMNPGKDMYSYFGALPNKGESNFIPVNSDFSAFRR